MNSAFTEFKKEKLHEYGSPRSDLAVSKPNRFRRTRQGLYGSADSHYAINELEFIRTREYIRDMERNDGTSLIKHIVDTVVDNSIQQGFTFDPQTGDDKLDKELKDRWHYWSTDPDECDISGQKTFWDYEKLALRQTIIDGDIVFWGTKEGRFSRWKPLSASQPGEAGDGQEADRVRGGDR